MSTNASRNRIRVQLEFASDTEQGIYEELLAIRPRYRAERLRQLIAAGLSKPVASGNHEVPTDNASTGQKSAATGDTGIPGKADVATRTAEVAPPRKNPLSAGVMGAIDMSMGFGKKAGQAK